MVFLLVLNLFVLPVCHLFLFAVVASFEACLSHGVRLPFVPILACLAFDWLLLALFCPARCHFFLGGLMLLS